MDAICWIASSDSSRSGFCSRARSMNNRTRGALAHLGQRCADGRGLEGTDVQHGLTGEAQRLAAGDEDVGGRALAQQVLDQPGGGGDDVLAAVEHEQDLAMTQLVDDALGRPPRLVVPRGVGARAALLEAEGGRHGGGHVLVVTMDDLGQVGEPHAPRERLQVLGGDLQRQAGLAGATAAGDRAQAVVGDQPAQVLDLRAAPDELREPLGQVVGPAVERVRRRRSRRRGPVGRAGRAPGGPADRSTGGHPAGPARPRR